MRMLRKGTELRFWIREGKGTKGEPHIYRKKKDAQDTELAQSETNKAEEICI